MTGQISNAFNFSTVLTIRDLQALYDYLTSEYNFFKFTISTKDGAEYDIINFNEILEYDNSDHKKIIEIILYAYKEKSDYKSFSDLEIKLRDSSIYSESIRYTFKKVSPKEIISYTSQLNELLLKFKAPCNWIQNKFIPVTFASILNIFFVVYFINNLKTKIDPSLYFLYILTITFTIGYFSSPAFKILISYFFPRTVFCIGRQLDFFERKRILRQNVLYAVIIAFIISVCASLVVYLLTK